MNSFIGLKLFSSPKGFVLLARRLQQSVLCNDVVYTLHTYQSDLTTSSLRNTQYGIRNTFYIQDLRLSVKISTPSSVTRRVCSH